MKFDSLNQTDLLKYTIKYVYIIKITGQYQAQCKIYLRPSYSSEDFLFVGWTEIKCSSSIAFSSSSSGAPFFVFSIPSKRFLSLFHWACRCSPPCSPITPSDIFVLLMNGTTWCHSIWNFGVIVDLGNLSLKYDTRSSTSSLSSLISPSLHALTIPLWHLENLSNSRRYLSLMFSAKSQISSLVVSSLVLAIIVSSSRL